MPFPRQEMSRPILLCLVRCGLVAGLLVVAMAAFAAEAGLEPDSPDWLQLSLGLFGGLAMFLSGLQMLSEGMTKAAGDTLRDVLAKLTTNRIAGALTGAFVTGVLNSSTVTTLLVVGFISSGLMTLTQSVGVIMGANIGSTVTAQLLAFDLAAYSLGPVALGFFMVFGAKQDRVKHYGMMTMGIGLVFYGMGLMGDAMTPLRSFAPFLEILEGLERPAAGIVAGAEMLQHLLVRRLGRERLQGRRASTRSIAVGPGQGLGERVSRLGHRGRERQGGALALAAALLDELADEDVLLAQLAPRLPRRVGIDDAGLDRAAGDEGLVLVDGHGRVARPRRPGRALSDPSRCPVG